MKLNLPKYLVIWSLLHRLLIEALFDKVYKIILCTSHSTLSGSAQNKFGTADQALAFFFHPPPDGIFHQNDCL